jgi:hypothetical protein
VKVKRQTFLFLKNFKLVGKLLKKNFLSHATIANLKVPYRFVNCQHFFASASVSRKEEKTSFAVIIIWQFLVINMYSRLKSNSKFEIFRFGWKKPPHPA